MFSLKGDQQQLGRVGPVGGRVWEAGDWQGGGGGGGTSGEK